MLCRAWQVELLCRTKWCGPRRVRSSSRLLHWGIGLRPRHDMTLDEAESSYRRLLVMSIVINRAMHWPCFTEYKAPSVWVIDPPWHPVRPLVRPAPYLCCCTACSGTPADSPKSKAQPSRRLLGLVKHDHSLQRLRPAFPSTSTCSTPSPGRPD